MFTSLQRSWDLTKASWSVLKSDKELLVFPLVSLVASIIVMITFAIPLILTGGFGTMNSNGDSSSNSMSIAGIIIVFLFYLVTYTVTIFSNTALVGAAMMRLEGQDPTLRDGINIAMSRLSTIIGYAAISATVGMVLNALSRRGGLVGKIAASLFGLAWSVATFMVIPILVVENVGPVEAVKRSTALLKKTWGEQLVGTSGMGLIFGLIGFGIFLLGVVLIGIASSTNSAALIIISILVLVLALVGMGLFSAALGAIYQAALYRYAMTGEVNQAFPADTIRGAFKVKNG